MRTHEVVSLISILSRHPCSRVCCNNFTVACCIRWDCDSGVFANFFGDIFPGLCLRQDVVDVFFRRHF